MFTYDKVIIPIHLGVHWTLAVINLKAKQLEYFDSMGGISTGKNILNHLRKYLEDEHNDKKKLPLDTSSWTMNLPSSKQLPQQKNSDDCGVFACKFANYVAQDKQITFSQEHIPYFRKRMVLEIKNAKIV